MHPPTKAATEFNGEDTLSKPEPDVLLKEIEPLVTSTDELGSKPIRLAIQDMIPGLRQDTLRIIFEDPDLSSVNSSNTNG